MIISSIPDRYLQHDVTLLEKILRKDISAFSELYDRYSTLLFSIITRMVKEKEESENILQEVFINVWYSTVTYDQRFGNPAAWLSRIARNRAADSVRSKNDRHVSQESEIINFEDIFTADLVHNPERRAILSRQQEEILIALTSLSNEQKKLIEFAYFRGYTLSELAGHLKLPLGTVKSRIRTAVSILRQKLRNHFV